MEKQRKLTLRDVVDHVSQGFKTLDVKMQKQFVQLEERLAGSTARGLADVEERLTHKIEEVDARLSKNIEFLETTLNARADRIERRIDNTLVTQLQHEKLESRVTLIEKKVGLK